MALKATSRAPPAEAINKCHAGTLAPVHASRSSSFLPDFNCAMSHLGRLPLLDQVSSSSAGISILGKNLRIRPVLRAQSYVFSRRIATEQSKTPLKLSLFLELFFA